MTNLQEHEVVERFLERTDEDSFDPLFRIFSPQIVAFFRRRGHETSAAEDLAQEVMLTVYRKAGQLRDHALFRAWLFRVARNAACRHYAQRMREVPSCGDTLRGMNQRTMPKSMDTSTRLARGSAAT